MSDWMMIQELKRKREELQAERTAIDAKLEAVDTVIGMFGGRDNERRQETSISETSGNELQVEETLEPSSGSNESSVNGHSEKIAFAQEVREAVQKLEGEFKTQDIVQIIKAKYPRAEVNPTPVSTALGRMVKRKEGIRVAKEGEGWEPNIYERISDDNAGRENSVTEGNPMSS